MKLHEEFVVAEPVSAVWKFFEEPESVASCMPGVEHVTVLDQDNVQVRATQSVGPMTATFDAKVTVLERVTDELIRFRAAGRSVRGAIGNVRTENTVRLQSSAGGTTVAVDGEVVLAGALGSVGQKVIARQASKVTAQFAANLQRALSGEAPVLGVAGPGTGPATPARRPAAEQPVPLDRSSRMALALSGASAAMSAASAALCVVILIKQRRRAQ
jgi:carbon monoxide dehydrogenase subunit G